MSLYRPSLTMMSLAHLCLSGACLVHRRREDTGDVRLYIEKPRQRCTHIIVSPYPSRPIAEFEWWFSLVRRWSAARRRHEDGPGIQCRHDRVTVASRGRRLAMTAGIIP